MSTNGRKGPTMTTTDLIPPQIRRALEDRKANPPQGYRRYYYLVAIIEDVDRLLQFGAITAKELAEIAGVEYGAFRKQLVKARAVAAKMAAAGVRPSAIVPIAQHTGAAPSPPDGDDGARKPQQKEEAKQKGEKKSLPKMLGTKTSAAFGNVDLPHLKDDETE